MPHRNCSDFGLGEGTMVCRACGYDASGCAIQPICGNGLQEPSEECDGTDLPHDQCADFGLGEGTMACRACRYDPSVCSLPPNVETGVKNQARNVTEQT